MTQRTERLLGYGLVLIVTIGSMVPRLLANGAAPDPAPEIDGSTISAGMGLATAAVLILRSRRRQ